MKPTKVQRSVSLAVAAACALIVGSSVSAAAPQAELGNGMVSAVTLATQSGPFHRPLDSTPDRKGTTIYFTASGLHGQGIFRAPTGGGGATEVYTGSPFVSPRGIAMSPDGQKLFVTDPAAGEIFVLPIGAAKPSALAGSIGTAPQNLDVVVQHGKQVVYFSGKDPNNGLPAVLMLPTSGASAPLVVAEGAPLVNPDGIAVTQGGIVYVADRAAAGQGMGKIFKVTGGVVTPILNPVRTGNPAGIALAGDDAVLLVSALQLHTPSDQVVLVDLATLRTGSVTKVVSQNHAAGGLHRQPMGLSRIQPISKQQLFSWADVSRNGRGAVYAVQVAAG